MPPEAPAPAAPVVPDITPPSPGTPEQRDGRRSMGDFRATLRERDERRVRGEIDNAEPGPAPGLPTADDSETPPDSGDLEDAINAAGAGPGDDEPAADDAEQEQQQEDLLEAAILGELKGRDLLQALKSGVIDAKLFQKLASLTIEWEADGPEGKRLVKMAMGELPGAALRQGDYSRKTAELRAEKDAAKEATARGKRVLENQRALFESWKNPQALYRDMRRMGLGNSVFEVAAMLAERHAEAGKLPEEARRVFLENIELRERQEDLDYRRQRDQRRMQQREQQQRQQQAVARDNAVLQRLVPAALEAAGLDVKSRTVQELFRRNLPNFVQRGRITPELVAEAAAATKQEWDDLRDKVNAPATAAPQPGNGAPKPSPRPAATAPTRAPLPPQALPGGGPAARKPVARRGGTLQDFKKFRGSNGVNGRRTA